MCQHFTTTSSSDEQNIFWLYKERFLSFYLLHLTDCSHGR